MCAAVTATEDRTPRPFTVNSTYPQTLPAVLQIVQVVFAFIAYLCAALAPWWTTKTTSGFRYFEWVCLWHMCSVIVLYLLVVLNVHHRLQCINWFLTEFIHYFLASIFFFTGSITAAALSRNRPMTVAAAFGFFCLLLYAAGAFIAFKQWRTKPVPGVSSV